MRGNRIAPAAAAAALGGATVAWCGWVSGFHRTTAAATITWACSLAGVVAVDLLLSRAAAAGHGGRVLRAAEHSWPRPGRGGPRNALWGVAPWLGIAIVAAAWDVLGLDTGPHAYHLTLSALAQAYRPLNAALLLGWLGLGLGFHLARLRAPIATRPLAPGHGLDRSPPSGPSAPVVAAAGLARPAWHRAAPGLLLPQSPAAGVAFWVALPLAAVGVDISARRSGGRVATAEEFSRFVSTAPLAHAGLALAWVAAGYHLFVR